MNDTDSVWLRFRTGFGGSAETRTEKVNALQISLLEHQAAGILPVNVTFGGDNMMPEEVVRGAMIIRVNSLTRYDDFLFSGHRSRGGPLFFLILNSFSFRFL